MLDYQVSLLTILTEIVSSGDDLETILQSTVRLIRELVQVDRVSILLLDPKLAALQMRAAAGLPDAVVRETSVRLGEGIAGEVARSGQPRLGTSEKRDPRYSTDSYISVPIIGDAKPIGVINITNKVDRTRLDQSDLDLMRAVARMLAVTIDRMQLHHEVDQLASRLGKVVASMPAGVLVLDMTGMVVASNPAANRLLRGRLDPGADILSIPDPVAGRELRRLAIECLAAGEERAHESRVGRGKEAVPVRLRAVPTRGTTDERPDALIIIEDLSLSREVEQLRQLDEMKSNFITLVSHELRTPITSIRGACSLVLNFYSSTLDEAPLNLIRIMGANVERLSGVVNSILDISLLDQQRLELSLEPVDLSVLVEHVMTDHVGAIEDRQLTVEWLCPDDLPPVTADPQRLRQAIDALVDNAIKFTERKGHIHVEAEVENGILNFSVEDSGHGIPAEYRELVFHKFYQIEDPMTRRAGGAGVGLYIAREIAHLHRGHLHATDPIHGPGARLVLSIPM